MYSDVKESKIDTIICSSVLLDVSVKLLWQVKGIRRLVLIDGGNPFLSEQSEKEVQSILWDNIANDGMNIVQQSGWISSFTGNPFTDEEMNEYVKNVTHKLSNHILQKDEVLEIGVASGITCMAVAPLVKKYYGIDVSQVTLDKTKESLEKKGISNVSLKRLDASEISGEYVNNIDVVIINSVAQYFPGYNYFLDVLSKCVEVMKDKGVIFLGDIQDFDLQDEFDKELTEKTGQGRNKRDLWYPSKLMESIPYLVTGVKKVEISSKVGKIENELKKYRKDVMIYVDKQAKSDVNKSVIFYTAVKCDSGYLVEECNKK